MKIYSQFYRLAFFFILVLPLHLFAQGIQGTLNDTESKPIPFATIYAEGAEYTTTSNSEGHFKLKLPAGKHTVFFQFMGYETHKVEVNINDEYITLSPVLKEMVYVLKDVKVKASSEDPAYFIMRKAIGMRSYYEMQIDSFQAKAYVKGSVLLHELPKVYRMMMSKEDRKEIENFVGKPMVIESIAEVSFKQPNTYKNKILATRSSIPSDEADPMPMVMSSLYNERIMGSHLSPLASTAFKHYRFSYEGFFEDDGRYINKIKVSPRHKGEGLFEGHIYITDELWNIHSSDLIFEKEFTDIRMKQTFAPVDKQVWMPVTYDITAKASMMGIKADVHYVVSVKSYDVKLNPKLDHSFFLQTEEDTNEDETKVSNRKEEIEALLATEQMNNRQMRKLKRKIAKETKEAKPKRSLEIKEDEGISLSIDSLATKKGNQYWNEVRPVPLTQQEIISYEKKDSIVAVQEGKDPIDADTTLTKSQKRWKKTTRTAGQIVFGKSFKKGQWNYSGLLKELSYNTVDGWKPSVSLSYRHKVEKNTAFQLAGRLRYAVARNQWLPTFEFKKSYSPMRRGNIEVEGGVDSFDFNVRQGVSPALNTFSTLFLKWNLMKLYEKQFIRINHQIDIANGLILENSFEFANRRALQNNHGLDIFKWNREFSRNSPENAEQQELLFTQQKAFILSGAIQYTPLHRYRIHKGRKYMARAEYPTYKAEYRKAIAGVNGSTTEYDYLSLAVHQKKELSFQHNIRYLLKTGMFFNTKELTFADYHHFRNIQLPFYFGESFGTYRLFNYYEQSTSESFLQANISLNSKRLLLKRLPLLNETFINESIFINYLHTPAIGHYAEIGYALTEIFFVANLEVATGFKGNNFEGFTVKLGLNLN